MSKAQPQHLKKPSRTAVLLPILALVVGATLLGLPFRGVIEPTNQVMVYLLAVVMGAVRWGSFAAGSAALLSVLAFDLFFIPPYYRLVVADAQYLITFAVLTLVGLLTARLAAAMKEQSRLALQRAETTSELYALARELAAAEGTEEICRIVETHFQTVFDWEVRVEFQAGEGLLALDTGQGIAGYLRLPAGARAELADERELLLDSLTRQAASALRRARLADQARSLQLLAEKEHLQSSLLNSISHDLRTPLASITGALTSLQSDHALLNSEQKLDLIDTALGESLRLNRYVGHLLDMTRLESAAIVPDCQPVDLDDVISVAREQAAPDIPVRLKKSGDIPLVSADYMLLLQVMVNLLDNARRYSPHGIEIGVARMPQGVRVSVSDGGPGVPGSDLERIFDKFFRNDRREGHEGTGLGLSICKGFIEAHDGKIWAENRKEGGFQVSFELPCTREVAHV